MLIINKRNLIIIIIAIVGFVILPLIGLLQKKKIEKQGVYTLAKVYDISSGGKEGLTYKACYFYKGKKYKLHFSQASFWGLKLNEVIFIKIDTMNPELYDLLEFKRVPSDINLNDVPRNGWKTLPDSNY